MAATGRPIAYHPIPEHGHGTRPLPGLIAFGYPDGTADLVVFVPGRPDPVHFDRVPHGAGDHSWAEPSNDDQG